MTLKQFSHFESVSFQKDQLSNCLMEFFFFFEILDLVWGQDLIFLFLFFFLNKDTQRRIFSGVWSSCRNFYCLKTGPIALRAGGISSSEWGCFFMLLCFFVVFLFFSVVVFMNVKALPWFRSLLQGSNLKLCLNSQIKIMLVLLSLQQTHGCSHRIYSATCP